MTKHPEKFCSYCVSKFHEFMYVLLWQKRQMSSICTFYDVKVVFQVVTKCANNYRFLKIMFPLQTLTY